MGRRIRTTVASICAMTVAAAALAVSGPPAAAAQAAGSQVTATEAEPEYCRVTLTVISQWSNGYAVTFSVTNISTVPVRWRLEFVFAGPVPVLQAWNATATMSGSVATITPWPSTGVIPPGASVMVGMFNGSGPVVQLPQARVICTPA